MPEARRLCTRRPLLTGCRGREGKGSVAGGVGGGWTPRYFICHWNWSESGRRNGRLTVVFGHGTETQTMGLTKRSPTGHRRRSLNRPVHRRTSTPSSYASSGQASRLMDQGVVAGITTAAPFSLDNDRNHFSRLCFESIIYAWPEPRGVPRFVFCRLCVNG